MQQRSNFEPFASLAMNKRETRFCIEDDMPLTAKIKEICMREVLLIMVGCDNIK